MSQMNVSVTPLLAGYIRRKVKTGAYESTSEVVREALRRMQEAEQRTLRLAHPTAEDILTDLTEAQLAVIRGRVLAGLAEIEAGEFDEYEGREGLKQLAAEVKARGRKRMRDAARR